MPNNFESDNAGNQTGSTRSDGAISQKTNCKRVTPHGVEELVDTTSRESVEIPLGSKATAVYAHR